MLIATPSQLPASIFTHHHDIVIVATWWIANHFPFGFPGYLMRTKPVRLIALFLLEIGRAGALCAVMDVTASLHPEATIAVWIMGAFRCCLSMRSGSKNLVT